VELGRTGAWLGGLAVAPAVAARAAAREMEQAGYTCLWSPEGLGTREAIANASVLLAATERIRVASGIANIWARDAVAAACAARVLDDAWDGRFVLGLGVSHPVQVDPRGHRYARPVATMRAYLDAMDEAPVESPDARAKDVPQPRVPRLIAALRPRMLALAAERADGAHTYLVSVEHTARARAALGPDRVLAVEMSVVDEPDPAVARARARAAIGWYLAVPNYRDNLRWLGYGDADVEDGGSDRLVDDLVAHGDGEAIAARVEEHRAAGADHVALQPIGDDDDPLGTAMLRRLAPFVV
jgi:probable F420-dependent oxidoreductase